MAVSAEFQAFVAESLRDFGTVEMRRMFGGAGAFREGLMFGLIADEVLYLKVDATNRSDFESEGSSPFQYEKNGRAMELAYWRLPERLYDDPGELAEWARKAFAVAFEADRKKPAAKRKHQG